MKSILFSRTMIGVILTCLVLLVSSNSALASYEYQLLQSLGKSEGTPYGKLVQGSDGNFYGTTSSGGSKGYETVFKMNSSGSFSVLHKFGSDYKNGLNPNGLVQGSDGNLYGTTDSGGAHQYGTVFKLDLTGFGSTINGGLIQASDGSFYGTTYSSNGFDPTSTVYKIDVDGNFYITTYATGSADNYGWIYKMDSAGNFTLLHEFIDGNEGVNPYAPLVQASDGRLYGTTADGGRFGSGTVFQLDLSGNFQLLHEFDGTLVYEPNDLIQARDGSFYGITR